ncbi:hypothetical protein FB45DRAFT_1139042 [Roridomyces roridus]|uniref:Amidohydrolase-related domain-containing protein n=1 Tax=Roridomyces roridus TaxID=1738132 RepID=A0AAD7FTT5_9AGAR|nr:hypothetical protein FB45DRAFT_1139042 [Roridomyces roridus]
MDGMGSPPPSAKKRVKFAFLATVSYALATLVYLLYSTYRPFGTALPINAESIVSRCKALHLTPGPPDNFRARTKSDRFVQGTKPTLIRNASIWTGQDDGNEVVHGDILLDGGLIKQVGSVNASGYANLVVLDAAGAWVTPGIVDLHSHHGVASTPVLTGAYDVDSLQGLVLPWLRSLDGLNTHDETYRLSMAGGVTTTNVLPGSLAAIGGQAFVIKLRPTTERSPSSMLLEPPYTLNGTTVEGQRPRWRHMKHACGENPSLTFSMTRMDTQWAFRQAYNTARLLKEAQDAYCAKALMGEWTGLGEFPEDLQWEALVDVLRGRVKVHTHCYEAVDLDGMVRLSNEFKFPIAAFHHAHEAYLVPDLIKKTYRHPPALAIFAVAAGYKREAFRGSEFAARILNDNGLDVVMKSDHPLLNSRHLIYEAQQAHYYGLPANLALASVTSTPARIMGQDHRIGRIIEGFDADIVVWDSHPLTLGATPQQVFIDGIAQFEDPHVSTKPKSLQHAPITPQWEKEMADAIKYEGLPPLEPKTAKRNVVVFRNVGSIYLKVGGGVKQVFASASQDSFVVVEEGRITCTGTCVGAREQADTIHIDLEGGSITPGLTTYGSPLGLTHIIGEPSTTDGPVFDPLSGPVPSLVGGTLIKAADGLVFASRDAYLGYHNGVTSAVVAPMVAAGGFLAGLSAVFSTGATHKLVDAALVQEVAAVHVVVSMASTVSVSTQIGALRRLLFGGGEGEVQRYFQDVVAGIIPLVVNMENADIIASLITLKKEVEAAKGNSIRLTIAGATEAHLLAKEISEAGVGVILQQRPIPTFWEKRRILPGPPLTEYSAIAALVRYNVTVGIMVDQSTNVRNTRFDAAWAALESNGILGKAEALALASTNLETLLGVGERDAHLVATRGAGSDFESKVVAIISPRSKSVYIV